VPAAVTEIGLMAYQHLLRPESVAVWAAGWWSGDPLPVRRLNQLAGIWHASMLFAVLTWRIGNAFSFESEVWLPGDYETTYLIATIAE
jgi:hypothetical protein